MKLSHLLRRDPAKPSIAERATNLRTAVARAIHHRSGQVINQPEPASLPDESPAQRRTDIFSADVGKQHDDGRGHPDHLGRADAARGSAPRQGQDMGRHETFENAAPIAEVLLAGTMLGNAPTVILPSPGSREAWDAYGAACREHTLRTQFANDYPDLNRDPLTWWTQSSLSRALETGDLSPVEVARLYPLASERELRMAKVEHELNLGALHALAFADQYPHPAEEDEVEEDFGADAELIRLGREFDAAAAREAELDTIASAACEEVQRRMPKRPAALLIREEDRPFNLRRFRRGGVPPAGAEVERGDVEGLRGRTLTRRVERPVTPEDGLPSDARTVVGAEPWPEAQARADEIVAAWDAWSAERDRIQVECGEVAAEEAADAASRATRAIVERIAAEPTTTAAGFRVKLRAIFQWPEEDDGRDQSTEALILRSLQRDVSDDGARPSKPVDRDGPPLDLIAACDAAVARLTWVNTNEDPDEAWPDDRVTAENERFDAVLDRAAVEPARGSGDLAAKARLLLCEYRDHVGESATNAGERALSTLLREIAGLAAATPARDWLAFAAVHPGMAPCPSNAPTVLLALDLAIRGEAQRLLDLAEAEIERRRQAYVGFHDPTVWPRVERSLRREMRMEALALAAGDLPEDDEAPDPVLAVIAASRRAEAEMQAFGKDPHATSRPGWFEHEQSLAQVQTDTRDVVWATVPTTRAGRLALVEYARFQANIYGIEAPGITIDVEVAERLLVEILDAFTAAVRAERPENGGAGHGLSALTVHQLARFYETMEALWRITGSFLNAPFSWDGRRENYGPLGRCIERETERLAALLTAISREIGGREPADDDERDERLAILASHSILCNGPIEDRRLVAEIAAAWGG